MVAIPALLFLAISPQDARPGAGELFQQARTFIPAFEGDHRAFLTAGEERDVTAAARLLEASLALEPINTAAFYWHGYCEVLLGENQRNRGHEDAGRAHYVAALASYERSLELDTTSFWAHYARAMALHNLDSFWAAIDDYDRAVELTNAVIARGEGDPSYQNAAFVRFKARQWRADTRMRAMEYDTARAEFRSFYADNGDNQWDLGYSLAETFLHARDFAGARETYANILAVEEFRGFESTYAQLGYLAGLLDDRVGAMSWIDQALENEFSPGMYTRLWLWILATDERRSAARADLAGFLQHPPSDLSPWDLRLGRFVLGDGTPDELLAAARAEEERRKNAAESLDDLACEAWFYVGLRLEEDAAGSANTEQRAALLRRALDAHRMALTFRPRQTKWEWEFARKHLADLARALELAPDPGFELEGDRIRLEDGSAGTVERLAWHTTGTERAETTLDPAALRPGDLVLCVVRGDDGEHTAARLVVDAR